MLKNHLLQVSCPCKPHTLSNSFGSKYFRRKVLQMSSTSIERTSPGNGPPLDSLRSFIPWFVASFPKTPLVSCQTRRRAETIDIKKNIIEIMAHTHMSHIYIWLYMINYDYIWLNDYVITYNNLYLYDTYIYTCICICIIYIYIYIIYIYTFTSFTSFFQCISHASPWSAGACWAAAASWSGRAIASPRSSWDASSAAPPWRTTS